MYNSLFILIIVIVILIYKKENFSLSTKPFEPDNYLQNRNPFDDLNYVIPTYKPYQ